MAVNRNPDNGGLGLLDYSPLTPAEYFGPGANPARDVRRFGMKVAPCPMSGCWLWAGYGDDDGYGLFYAQGVLTKAHRFAYEYANGPIPQGMVLDHVCRVRACVNPDHLRIATNRENVLDARAVSPSAINARRSHCVRGHLLSGANLNTQKDGHRSCRRCAFLRQRKRQGLLTETEAHEWQ